MDDAERRKRWAERFREKAAHHAKLPKGHVCSVCGNPSVRNECPKCLEVIADALEGGK